jgi:hypothetical protein
MGLFPLCVNRKAILDRRTPAASRFERQIETELVRIHALTCRLSGYNAPRQVLFR